MPLKLGRKPAVHNRYTFSRGLALARSLDPLGSAPAESNDYVSAVMAASPAGWGMEGNDSVGDCTFADCAHQIMLHTANAGTIVIPSTQDTIAAYSACTGYNPADPSTDQGADEVTVCQFMQSTGLLGQKVDAFGSVDPTQLDHVKWCNQIFGACRLGINLPQSAMDQFNAGQPWDDIGDTNIIGGHDIPIVKYDRQFYYVVTWGKLQPVTPRFMANQNYVEEAHAEVWFDWVRATQGISPAGFDLAQLVTDLKEVA